MIWSHAENCTVLCSVRHEKQNKKTRSLLVDITFVAQVAGVAGCAFCIKIQASHSLGRRVII